jgi:hypothetical protein
MIRTLIDTALVLTFGAAALPAHAATLNNGDTLTIATGITTDSNDDPLPIGAVSGSWFAIDGNGDGAIAVGETESLSQGTTGLVIGQPTTPGANSCCDYPGATNAITAPTSFLGTIGSFYTKTGVTGSTTSGLDMSGWSFVYNGLPANPGVELGTGAWTPTNAAAAGMAASGYTNGIGVFSWDGVYGHSYTLDYTATVPTGNPSGFGGYKWAFHLTGTVPTAAVPEATTYGMMLAGLGLVGFAARRRYRL